ncbi:flagellar protein FlaG [Brevibacillus sp. MCWH]|uniref:flagellar protein FlaG n=1 Tax=Brevibacillus sp. MCWH TaxID=2508871 RepID=UPI001490BBD8|nr:flagellar protein FlaG [Brevibacillus sp. MCWH]NNV01358.1 flagellar protein FlaG [Brevibacillus sp. MCWH]
MDINAISARKIPETAKFDFSVGQGSAESKHIGQHHDVKLSKEQLQKELDNLNKFVQSGNTHLKFTFHEKLNEYYVQIIDDQTNEVIREVPSKKILDMVAKIHEMIGLLVDEKR